MRAACSGDTEAEEEQPPRRVTTRPQANPRRLLGGQSATPRAAPGAAASSRRAAGRPKKSKSQSSIIRQDLLAPVRPGHESEEDSASEAGTEQPARSDAGEGTRAGAGAGLSLRRLGDGPRASPQRGAAALRDVREDFVEAGDLHHDGFMQGGSSHQWFSPPLPPPPVSEPPLAHPPAPWGSASPWDPSFLT